MLPSLIITTKPVFDKTVKHVLQGNEYRNLGKVIGDFIEGIKKILENWLIGVLKKIFNSAAFIKPASSIVSTIFIVIGLGLLLVIIVIIIIKICKTFDRKSKIKEILGEKIDRRTTPSSLRAKALSFKNMGDFRQAIRYDFISLLFLMHQRNILYLDETKTNEEIYNYLKLIGFLRLSVFGYLSDTFNSSWYGNKIVEENNYRIWSDNINKLWNEEIVHENKSQ